MFTEVGDRTGIAAATCELGWYTGQAEILLAPLRWFGLIVPNDQETENFLLMLLGGACPLGCSSTTRPFCVAPVTVRSTV